MLRCRKPPLVEPVSLKIVFEFLLFVHRIKPYSERYGAARWQEAVAAATRDMIDQLKTETPAERLREKHQ